MDDNALMSHPLPAGTRFLALNGESIEHATMQEIASIFATTSQLLTVVSYAPKQYVFIALGEYSCFTVMYNVFIVHVACLRCTVDRHGSVVMMLNYCIDCDHFF